MADFRDILIQKIIENIEVKEGRLSVPNYQIVDRYSTILISELLEKEGFQKKFCKIQYLGYSQLESPVFIPPFQKVFIEMKLEGDGNYEKFKSKVDKEISEIQEGENLKNYDFLYPIRLKFTTPPKAGNINGVFFEFKRNNENASIFSDKKLSNQLDLFQRNYSTDFSQDSFQYLKITLRARDLWYAERKATKLAQFVISVVSFIENYRRMKTSFPNPAISDLNIELIIAFCDNKFERLLANSLQIGKRHHQLSDEQIECINVNLEIFKTSHKSVRDIIRDGFISFHSGLNETRMGYAFLNFWTAAEILCLKNQNITEKEVIKRLMSPILNKDDITKHELERLYDLRNKIVHNAEYELATEFDRNIMKMYVEPFIDFFIDTLSKFPRSKIEKIYRYLPESDEILNEDKELIDFILSLRENND